MKALRNLLDQAEPLFHKGGPLEKLYALYEAADTFLYTPGRVTDGPTHVRDGIDLKRTMITVVVALVPCIFMAMWNTGYQSNLAMQQMGVTTTGEWRGVIIDILGIGGWIMGRALRNGAQARDQRGVSGDGNALSLDAATDDSALAGGGRNQFWRGVGEGSLWRYG